MKIKPDCGAANGKVVYQDALDEIVRAQFRQACVEGKYDRAVEASRREQPQLGGLVGEAEQRLLRIKERAWMRLEGERGRWLAECAGPRLRGRDHCFMAAMHAVEIADGDGRTAKRGGRRKIAHDREGFRRHRPLTRSVRASRRAA